MLKNHWIFCYSLAIIRNLLAQSGNIVAMMHHETWKSSVVNVDGLWLGRGGGGPPTDVGIANRDCVSWSPSLTIPSSKCSYIFKKIETTETFIYFTCYSFQSLVESVSTLLFIYPSMSRCWWWECPWPCCPRCWATPPCQAPPPRWLVVWAEQWADTLPSHSAPPSSTAASPHLRSVCS